MYICTIESNLYPSISCPILRPQRFHEALALEGIHTGSKGADAGEDETLRAQNVLGLLHEAHLVAAEIQD